MQGQSGELVTDISDCDVTEAVAGLAEPGHAGTAADHHEAIAGQLEDRAVVNDSTFVRAPDGIGDTVETELSHIPCDHPVDHGFRIRS